MATLTKALTAKPKAIAFDCYRTLFQNDHDAWRVMFGEIIESQGLPFDQKTLWDKWRKYELEFRATRTVLDDPSKSPPFKTYQQAWTECFDRVFEDEDVDGDAAAAGKRCVEHLASRPVFPDTVPGLRALKGKVRTGVFSNADDNSLRPLLKTINAQFDVIASSESSGVYKPAPAAFELILGLLGVDAADAWYVGDHLYDDVRGGNDVGLTTVWINRAGEKAEKDGAVPAIEISDLRELATLVDSIPA
jgi:2-haloalkanoic acid dehalogenase type II